MIYPDFWKKIGIFICKSWPQGFKGGQFMIFPSYLFNVIPGNWAGSNPGKLENSESWEIGELIGGSR